MRVALCARVSTRDKDQNPENQLVLLRREAERTGSSEGSEAVFEHTARPDQCGVAFRSYCEPMRNTTGPMAALYKAIIAWAAGYRNQRHRENVRLGQARKRVQVEAGGGTHRHGRQPTAGTLVAQVRALAAQGLSRR